MQRILLLLTIATFLPAAGAGAEDWPMLARDVGRSGRSTETLAADRLQLAWTVSLDAESIDGSPAVVEGRVYVGTATGKVVCVAAADGAKLWERATGGAVLSAPAVDGGRVFVGSADRFVYALAATDGRVLWRHRTRGAVVAPPLVHEGRVYVGSMDGTFNCLAADTGRVVWSVSESAGISAGAVLAGDALYYGDEAGQIQSRGLDGKLRWSYQVKGSIVATPTVAGDSLLVPVMSGTALSPPHTDCLLVLNRESGEKRWAMHRQSSIMHTPASDGSSVYVATVSGYLSETEMFALRVADGQQLWRRKLGGVADSSPAQVGEYLLLGNHDSNFYVLSARTGAVALTVPLGGKAFASPAISNGSVFIGIQGGKLHCLKVAE